MADYKGRIGNLIRDARKHRGLTQHQLAELLGTSQSAINRIEKGHQNLSLEMLARIGAALDSEIVALGAGPTHLRVDGPTTLSGSIDVKTSKNAGVALLCASLLNKGRTTLRKVARIEEVNRLLEVLNSLGVATRWVDADFFAGWIALVRLNNPAQAAQHFEALRQSSTTPITQSRALYWLGRAADAQGDEAAADAYYQQAARYNWAFYGQLAAERANMRTLRLPPEPQPTEADRARFESYPLVQAIRIFAAAGETSLMRVFVMHLDDSLTNAEDYALLVDLTRGYGIQDLSMHVARTAAQRGWRSGRSLISRVFDS